MSVPSGHADRSLHARFKQVSIAFFCHPVCAREMAVVDKPRTLRFLLRVKPEDHSDGFAPVGSLSLRVEQAKITRQMLLIVRSDAVQFGRSILNGGIVTTFLVVFCTINVAILTAVPGLFGDGKSASRRRRPSIAKAV